MGTDLVLVGNSKVEHVGAHLLNAARELGLEVTFCDVEEAYSGPAWLAKFNWLARGHRPCRLGEFSQNVLDVCLEFRPRRLLATGLAPIDWPALKAIGECGVRRLNYLTDDPWNPSHRSPWFLKTLPLYDHVFSPRITNLEELKRAGCREVSYLPFAYAPEIHFPDPPAGFEEEKRFASDVAFVGGADRSRVPYLVALIKEGYHVALYGGYWPRFRETRAYWLGYADPHTQRKAIGGAKVALCLVRRANRDGHVMRSFEVPAVGGCMLAEDTEEHRDIFGGDAEAVVYFKSLPEMLDKVGWLLGHDGERHRLAGAAHKLVVGGGNTYKDRMQAMLQVEPAS